MSVYEELSAPFDNVHWRAQTLKADGTSALALAYIDARDVMERLDAVLGPENWQDRYTETPKGRLICTLALRINGEWIEKQDGAGETDVEGEKGAISDALKRTAVKWGVGRYLYALPATWAECECYERNGKKQWKAWAPQALRKLLAISGPKAAPIRAAPKVETITEEQWAILESLLPETGIDMTTVLTGYSIRSLKELPAAKYEALRNRVDKEIRSKQKEAA